MVSLGQSTNQTYTTLAQGAISTVGNWATSLASLVSTKTVSMSANAQYQLAITQVSTATSVQYTSTLGTAWSAISNASGLPTATQTNYSAGAVSGNGKYQLITAYGGYPYLSNNYGSATVNTNTPYIYLPLEGSVTDSIGNSNVVAIGSPAFTTGVVGTNAIYLNNTAGSATPTQYIRGAWTVPSAFTVSLWFNIQQLNATYQVIFSALGVGIELFIDTSNRLAGQIPSGSGTGQLNIYTSALTTNIWYNAILIGQIGGTSSLYLNNVLVGNFAANTGFGTWPVTNTFALGTYDNSLNYAFKGYIDDVKIYNSVLSNYPPNSNATYTNVNANTSYIYLPLDGNVTDSKGNSTVTATGSPGYVSGIVGTSAINLANGGLGTGTQYVRGTWATPAIFTVTGWFNWQIHSATQSFIFSACTGTVILYAQLSTNYLALVLPGGNTITTSYQLALNTWYNFAFIIQSGSTCSLYVNNALVGTAAATTVTSSGAFGLGTYDTGTSYTNAFTGYIDDITIYNSVIIYNPSTIFANVNPNTPYIYLPFEGILTDRNGNSTVTATGSPGYTTGIVGSSAIYFNNSAGGTATQYVRGTWTVPNAFIVNLWFNTQAINQYQIIFSALSNGVEIFITNGNLLAAYIPQGSSSIYALYSTNTLTLNTWYNTTLVYQAGGTSSLYLNNALIGNFTQSTGLGGYAQSGYFGLGTYDASLTLAFNGYIDDVKIYNSIFTLTPMVPMNYNNVAISTTGQYQLVSAVGAGLYMSSNYGSTWSQVTSSMINAAWSSLAMSAGGQCMIGYAPSTQVVPQLTGLNGGGNTTTTWSQNGVTWTCSASTVANGSLMPWCAFDNLVTASGQYSWASAGAYDVNNGICSSSVTTIVQGLSSIRGEWLQIKSSIPLILYSYNFGSGGYGNIPQTYYYVGSHDGTTWYPIFWVSSSSANPFGASNPGSFISANSANIIINQSGQQVMSSSNGSGILTCNTFPTTTMTFTYFRIIDTRTYGQYGNFEFTELYLRFNTPSTSYSTNYGSTWTNVNTLTLSSCLAVSGSGQYAIATNSTTVYIITDMSQFVTGTGYTTPIFSPVLVVTTNIPIAAAISNLGQYMVIVTNNTSGNNVYYSSNYGTSFTGLTLGSTALTSCTIAYDGSYITVSNATTVYTLNNNSSGYTVAIGSQAGASTQMQNAVAIGTQAGLYNQGTNSIAIGAYAGLVQAGNSIILNASGQTLNTTIPGFFVSPISAYTQSSASMSLLTYGADNQITQTTGAITLLSSGYVGIGTTNPTSALQVIGNIAGTTKTFDIPHPLVTGKQLVHSAIEGPRCDLIYRGITVLNNGTATVYIDTQCTYDPTCAMDQGTFTALCANPQYFLQNMTGFDQVIGTIQGAILTITCENTASMDTIHWTVVAERKDSFIKQWDRTNANGYLITQYST